MRFLAYVTERLNDRNFPNSYYRERVHIDIYEAPDKKSVLDLILADFPEMGVVRQKMSRANIDDVSYITTIHPLDANWEAIWTAPHQCNECHNTFTKLDRAKMRIRGGGGEFCSEECQRAHYIRFAPPSSFDIGTVYMITHKPTGRRYIGVTVRWVMQRWWEHLKAESGSPLHKLIKSEGIENFTFEILVQFKPSEIDAYAIEAEYIRKYNAREAGLNAVDGHKTIEKTPEMAEKPNITRIIANKRPLSHDEMAVLNVYNLIAIIIFRRELTIESIEFMVAIMRINNIAQQNIAVHTSPLEQNGMSIAAYQLKMHDVAQNISRGMMR